ncbi:MAG: hypothetical protein GY858_03790 [Candidatus Omnitrophica bacterium]|nr:hypothetical protein [Candidatus Omnitrophota bacterium]
MTKLIQRVVIASIIFLAFNAIGQTRNDMLTGNYFSVHYIAVPFAGYSHLYCDGLGNGTYLDNFDIGGTFQYIIENNLNFAVDEIVGDEQYHWEGQISNDKNSFMMISTDVNEGGGISFGLKKPATPSATEKVQGATHLVITVTLPALSVEFS